MKLRALTIPLLLQMSVVHAATDSQLLEMDFEELMDKQYVTIASGSLTPIDQAAAVATIITADDIRAMGATDLDQVLQSVPGLYVSNTFSNYNPIYAFRGLYTQTNAETLMLLNGIPMTSLYRGDRGGIWGGMPVRAIARIEIIRGPGSAVYGADAFGGVINIITKTAENIPETEVGAGYGSFDTREAWLLTAGRAGAVSVAFTAEYSDTNGPDETIAADRQTILDQYAGTRASHAPGSPELSRRALDLHLDLRTGNWLFRGAYQGRDNVGNGAGFFEALDPEGRYESTRYTLDLQYSNPRLARNWELQSSLSMHHIDQQSESDTFLLPPGSFLEIPLTNNPPLRLEMPDGLIGNPEVWENNYRLDVTTFYTGFSDHRLRVSAGYHLGDIYRVRETKNYTMAMEPIPAVWIQPDVIDVSGTPDAFLLPADRENLYLSLQDEWEITDDWNLTTGVRYDYYSDFGDAINPRVALVWETTETVTTKFLYGRAFRAPSFSELYSANPVAYGNSDLAPQTINSYEVAVSVRATPQLRYGMNLFHYNARDLITYGTTETPSFEPYNEGSQKAHGGELELDYLVTSNLLLKASYSFLDIESQSSRGDIGNPPSHQVYARAEWRFAPEWLVVPQLLYIGEIERPREDSRAAVDDYVVVDLSLQRRNLFHKVDASLVIRNLFDQDVRVPASASIPDDLPKPGFQIYGSLAYRF